MAELTLSECRNAWRLSDYIMARPQDARHSLFRLLIEVRKLTKDLEVCRDDAEMSEVREADGQAAQHH
jgi:hypothetical protein